MDNVRFLRTKNITPEVVIRSVLDQIHNNHSKAVYVVLIDDNGEPELFASGDLSDLCYASQCLNVLAHRFLKGEIEDV